MLSTSDVSVSCTSRATRSARSRTPPRPRSTPTGALRLRSRHRRRVGRLHHAQRDGVVPADDEPGVARSAAVARLAIAHLGAACAQQLRLRAAPAWRHYRQLRSVVPATLHEWVIGARTLALEQ